MPILVSLRRLASDWDAKKNAWKIARKIEVYKSSRVGRNKDGMRRPR